MVENAISKYARARRLLGASALIAAGSLGLVACSSSSSTSSAAAPASSSSSSSSSPSSSSAAASSGTASATPASSTANTVALEIQTGKMDGKSGWPRYVPSDITLQKGVPVTIVITNHDDGTAPLPSALTVYDKVQGGTETIGGQTVTSVPNANVAHTWTIPSLGVNVVVPAAPTGGTNTVSFTFTPTKSGSFTWKCFAPCGSGSDGMAGAMVTPGWMMGTVTVS